jgi:hypothetical protein
MESGSRRRKLEASASSQRHGCTQTGRRVSRGCERSRVTFNLATGFAYRAKNPSRYSGERMRSTAAKAVGSTLHGKGDPRDDTEEIDSRLGVQGDDPTN